jgi:hypothetical protein
MCQGWWRKRKGWTEMAQTMYIHTRKCINNLKKLKIKKKFTSLEFSKDTRPTGRIGDKSRAEQRFPIQRNLEGT